MRRISETGDEDRSAGLSLVERLRAELQRLYVGTFTGPAGTYQQSTDLTSEQAKILAQLDITAPPRILDLATAG